MSTLRRVALWCALLVALVFTTSAQMPSLFLFPTNGMDQVDPSTTITIKTPAPIDPGCITHNYPDAEPGSVVAPVPTILLISERGDVVLGRYTLVDERTLTFHPRPLAPGTRYRCIVSNIALLNGGYAPLPTEEIRFTTVAEVPRILSCSLEGADQITCDKMIELRFNRSIREDLPDVLRTITLGATDMSSWPHPFDHGFALSQDGLTLTFTPVTRWPSGTSLTLTGRLSMITGDVLDDRAWTTVVRSAGSVHVTPTARDGRAIPAKLLDAYRSQEHVAVAGTAIDLVGIDDLADRWRFVRWESPLIDLPEDRNIHVTIPCELYSASIPITAILERLDTISVQITAGEGGVVEVYDLDGRRLAIVTDSTEVLLTDSLHDVRLIAKADTTFSFASWVASRSSLNGSPAPSVAILSSAVPQVAWNNGNTPQGPRIGPSFRKNQTASENYTLRGSIQDDDAQLGFNAADAVAFTTAKEFQSNVPGERTLCVEAERCWEIIGYTIAATGARVDIASTNNYCVTAELMDPENTVTFHVRRRKIQLRLEKVLLSSEDPKDVIVGKKPHAETYVRVEIRTRLANDRTIWTALAEQACDDNGIYFGNYALRCGDEVRLRVRGSAARNQTWVSWDPRVNYVLPGKTDETPEESIYTMVIDRDIANFQGSTCDLLPNGEQQIRIRGCFFQRFGVEAVGLRLRITNGPNRGEAYFAERWLDPLVYRDRLPEEPMGGRQMEYIPRHGTIVKVKFTAPIDVRTIHDGGMEARSYDNTLITEPLRTDLDFDVRSYDGEHISFEPVDGRPITTVAFSICDPNTSPRMQALHGGSIDLKCFTSITSLNGQPLLATARFILSSMELPGMGIFLRDITYDFDGDWDFIFENSGETYHAMFGGILGPDRAHETKLGFRRVPDCSEQQGTPPGECTLEHSDKDGPQRYADMPLMFQPYWMDYSDWAWWYAASYDEDCKDNDNCFVNKVQELLDLAREKTESYRSTDPEEPLEWDGIVPDIINLATGFVQALMPIADQDEHIGYGNYFETFGTWWGVKRASYPLVVLDASNARYRLVSRLFTLRSVVR